MGRNCLGNATLEIVEHASPFARLYGFHVGSIGTLTKKPFVVEGNNTFFFFWGSPLKPLELGGNSWELRLFLSNLEDIMLMAQTNW